MGNYSQHDQRNWRQRRSPPRSQAKIKSPVQAEPSQQRGAPPSVEQIAPLLLTIQSTTSLSGYSRSEIYRLIATQRLDAVKAGRRTLINYESLRSHVATLPAAMVRTVLKEEKNQSSINDKDAAQ